MSNPSAMSNCSAMYNCSATSEAEATSNLMQCCWKIHEFSGTHLHLPFLGGSTSPCQFSAQTTNGSFPEDMVLLLDTWVSVPQLLYHKIFPKMYWFSCAEPGTTSLRPFKVLSSNLCINLAGWIPMSLISFMLRQPRVGVLNENTGPFRGGCGPLCQISAQESNVVAAYCTQTHNQAPMQTVPFIK